MSVAEIPASNMRSILCSCWWILGTIGAGLGVAVAASPSMVGGESWAVSLFSIVASLLWLWICKGLAFRSVLDRDVKAVREQLLQFEPDVIFGYSWGGAVAIETIFQGYWNGPTLLLNPVCSPLAHARRTNHASLRNVDPGCVKIVASRDDILCGGDDAIRALARTSVAGPLQAVMFYEDDHMLSHLADFAVFDWVVSLMEQVYHTAHMQPVVSLHTDV